MTVSEDVVPDLSKEASDLRHMALRNANYHMARRRWLDGLTRSFNLLIILGGTGTAAEIARGEPVISLVLGGLIAAAGALQLVFDFSGRARLHEILQRRYYSLMADIECALDPTRENCANWKAEMTRVAADEPPLMRALDAVADNQATATLHGASGPRLEVTRWQYATRNLFAHEQATFPEREGWDA